MTVKLLKAIVPYPFIFLGEMQDGCKLSQSRYCRKCNSKACLSRSEGEGDFVCPKGFSCYEALLGDKHFIINGLVSPETRHNFRGERRKAYKSYRVTSEDISSLRSQLERIDIYASQRGNKQVRDSVSFLHEIRTSVGIVLSWCQDLIANQDGVSFEDQLSQVDRETANLFQSINLLQEQLSLADIIANPDSITYGHKHRSSVHGFIYKMVKLFEPRAEKKGSSISLIGKTFAEMEAYNSFQFIPLILLDNAIKYTFPGHHIRVYLHEENDLIWLKVSSYGWLVPEDYRQRIFAKYERGPHATDQHSQGMGLGLYMANAIALAHDTKIVYQPHPETGEKGDNQFSVAIHGAT